MTSILCSCIFQFPFLSTAFLALKYWIVAAKSPDSLECVIPAKQRGSSWWRWTRRRCCMLPRLDPAVTRFSWHVGSSALWIRYKTEASQLRSYCTIVLGSRRQPTHYFMEQVFLQCSGYYSWSSFTPCVWERDSAPKCKNFSVSWEYAIYSALLQIMI